MKILNQKSPTQGTHYWGSYELIKIFSDWFPSNLLVKDQKEELFFFARGNTSKMFPNWNVSFSTVVQWIALIDQSKTFSLSWRMQCLWVCAPASLCFDGLLFAILTIILSPQQLWTPKNGINCLMGAIWALGLHLWDVEMVVGSMTVPIGHLEGEI